MVRIENLHFSYPRSTFELDVPLFEVQAGVSTAIIGPSGSGKTTLLKLLSGLYKPEHGSVQFNETDISKLSDAQRRNFRITKIGFIFQDFRLIEYLNVMDNILHNYRLNKALKLNAKVKERAQDLASSVGIKHLLKRKPNQLSQGECQRVAICRALLSSPQLILADEATGNLDPESKKNVLDILLKYTKEHKAVLVAVTHDHELLDSFDKTFDFKKFRQSK